MVGAGQFSEDGTFRVLGLLRVKGFSISQGAISRVSRQTLSITSQGFFGLLTGINLYSFSLISYFFSLFSQFHQAN